MTVIAIVIVVCATAETIIRGVAKLALAAAGILLRLLFSKIRP